jgi:hypothetical protein
LESPETSRGLAFSVRDFNICLSSSSDERENKSYFPPTYASTAARAATGTSAADPGLETSGESAPAAEDRTVVEERSVELGSGTPTPLLRRPGLEVLDEPYSAQPAQRSSHTSPPGHIGWTWFQPMCTGGPVR